MGEIKGALFLSLAAAIWGGMYVVSKVVLDSIDPWLLLEFRFIVGLITLGGAAWYLKAWRIAKKDLGIMALIGLVGYTGSIGMQFVGVKLSNASLGSLITSASPALIAVFAFFINLLTNIWILAVVHFSFLSNHLLVRY